MHDFAERALNKSSRRRKIPGGLMNSIKKTNFADDFCGDDNILSADEKINPSTKNSPRRNGRCRFFRDRATKRSVIGKLCVAFTAGMRPPDR